MKKLGFKKKSDPDSAESGSENKKEKQKRFDIRRIDINKRRIIIAVLALVIILVLLFIRYGRHFDRRPMDPETNASDYEIRADITGKPPVVLTAGTYTAGIDIPTGRYIATTENGYGRLVIYEPGNRLIEITELIGYFVEPAYVPSVAVTLVENQKIVISGKKLREVTFTPLVTKKLNELTTGRWIVGLDINPGTYTVSSKDGRSGSLTVLEGTLPVGRVSLGKDGDSFKEFDTVTLLDGQIIRIANIPTVVFKAD